jgi:hypothetical protein
LYFAITASLLFDWGSKNNSGINTRATHNIDFSTKNPDPFSHSLKSHAPINPLCVQSFLNIKAFTVIPDSELDCIVLFFNNERDIIRLCMFADIG